MKFFIPRTVVIEFRSGLCEVVGEGNFHILLEDTTALRQRYTR